MMTLCALISALKAKGMFTIANYVKHGYYPTNTNASPQDIMTYCEQKGLNHAASLIAVYLEDNPDHAVPG